MAKKVTVKQLLTRARNYLRRGWTQGPFAVDAQGRSVDPSDSKACRFCAMGAMIRAGNSLDATEHVVGEAYDKLHAAAGRHFVYFNETPGRTKREVVAMFGRAIAGRKAKRS